MTSLGLTFDYLAVGRVSIRSTRPASLDEARGTLGFVRPAV